MCGGEVVVRKVGVVASACDSAIRCGVWLLTIMVDVLSFVRKYDVHSVPCCVCSIACVDIGCTLRRMCLYLFT